MQSGDYDPTQSAILLHYTTKYLQFFSSKSLHIDRTFPNLGLNLSNKVEADKDQDNLIIDYSLNSKYPSRNYNNPCESPNSEIYSNVYEFTGQVNHVQPIRKRQSKAGQNTNPKRSKIRTSSSNGISQTSQYSPIEDSLRSPISGIKILPINDILSDQTPKQVAPSGSSIQIEQDKDISDQDILNRLQKIPNLLGDYICQLCLKWFPDAICLARHLCPRMANLAYPCELCEKVFNCPANLASHRRWHRPELDCNRPKPKSKHKSLDMCHSNPINPCSQLMIETLSSPPLTHTIDPNPNSNRLEHCRRITDQTTSTHLANGSRPTSPSNTKECIHSVFRTSKHYNSGVSQVRVFSKNVKPMRLNTFSVEALLS